MQRAHPTRDGRLCHGKFGSATLAARHRFCRVALAAVFDRRTGAVLAHILCLAGVRSSFLWAVVATKFGSPPRVAAGNARRLFDGDSVVCRQLLLDLPDHVLFWRAAALHLCWDSG